MTALYNPRRLQLKMSGWIGGMNRRDSLVRLTQDEARTLENILLDRRGSAQRRSGVEVKFNLGPTGDAVVLSMYPFYRPGHFAPQLFAHLSDGSLWYSEDFFAGMGATWTQVSGTWSTTQPLAFETFNGKAYLCDGAADYAWWDGSTLTTSATAPKGRYLRAWEGAMWVAGVDDDPDKLFSSAAGDAETFAVDSWVLINRGDGDEITALANNGLFLVVGKHRSTHEVYDPVTFANRPVDLSKGIESHWGVVHYDNDMYFLSRVGICQYFGGSPSRIISDKIVTLFDENFADLSRLKYAVGSEADGRLIWSIATVVESIIPPNYNRYQLIYYPQLGGLVSPFGLRSDGPWTTATMPVHAFTKVVLEDNVTLFGGHSESNAIVELLANVRHDLGERFYATVLTGAFDFGDSVMTKYIARLRPYFSGVCRIQLFRDYEGDEYRSVDIDIVDSTDDDGFVNADSGETRKTNIDAYGRVFQFGFTDQVDEPTLDDNDVPEWSIGGLTVEGSYLGERT